MCVLSCVVVLLGHCLRRRPLRRRWVHTNIGSHYNNKQSTRVTGCCLLCNNTSAPFNRRRTNGHSCLQTTRSKYFICCIVFCFSFCVLDVCVRVSRLILSLIDQTHRQAMHSPTKRQQQQPHQQQQRQQQEEVDMRAIKEAVVDVYSVFDGFDVSFFVNEWRHHVD